MDKKNLGNKLLVHQIDKDTFTVITYNGITMVHLQSKMCSCQEFDLKEIPSQHVMTTLMH